MRKIILLICISAFSITIYPQDSQDQYNYAIVDNKVDVSDFVEFAELTTEQVFFNALLFAIEQGTREKENIERIDFENFSFTVKQQIISAENEETSYNYMTSFQVVDNMLSFTSSDIVLEVKQLFNKFATTPFEKLDPEKKPKHKVYLDEFVSGNSAYLNNMNKFIRTNEYLPITHWDDIKNGKLVKGMNETECILIGGKPINIRNSGKRIRWMFNNDFIVFFENGVITSIIK